jgi:hypothetical protein
MGHVEVAVHGAATAADLPRNVGQIYLLGTECMHLVIDGDSTGMTVVSSFFRPRKVCGSVQCRHRTQRRLRRVVYRSEMVGGRFEQRFMV